MKSKEREKKSRQLSDGSDSTRESIVVASLRLALLKDVPKSQSLVSGTRYNRLTIRRQGQVEDTKRVSWERCNLMHRRVFPHKYLVLRVTVGRHQLVSRL